MFKVGDYVTSVVLGKDHRVFEIIKVNHITYDVKVIKSKYDFEVNIVFKGLYKGLFLPSAHRLIETKDHFHPLTRLFKS